MAIPLIVSAALGLAAEFAPGLVRLLAGDNAGDVAEKVVGAAQVLTGTSTPDEAATALRADPGLALQFRKDMATIELERERMSHADRQDARGRDIKLKEAGYRNTRADLMVLGCVLAMVFMAWQINSGTGTAPEVLAIYNMAIGALLKMLGDAFQFEFGSSRGSKEKDAIMAGKG